MIDLKDPGTPEARRAWLDSLPVGAVVVDADGESVIRDPLHWLDCGKPVDDDGMGWWCRADGFWPVQSVAVMPPTLHTIAADIAAWQADTFGASSALATVAKMADEVAELRDELRQMPVPGTEAEHVARIREEAADVVFMAIDLMRAHGGVDALAAAMAAKLERNRARTWTQGADGKWSGSREG